MLKIQEHIRNHGLDKTIKKFSLNVKDLGYKVMLKYSQLDSPNYYKEVQESRGLILEKDSWNVISYPLERFFTHNDHLAPKLDWSKTVTMEKRDGTLIQVYYDVSKGEFVCNTMFSECEELLYFKGEKSDRSFKTLYNDLFMEYGSSYDLFSKTHTYVFELTSQYNKVVVKYDKPELRLIACRNVKNLLEHNFEELCEIASHIKIPIVEVHKFSSLQECIDSFNNMSFNFEGYVAWDGVHRIKIKNPSYVVVHLTKSTEDEILDLTKPYVFLDIVKQNEIDEFISSFPHSKEIITTLDKNYKSLVSGLRKSEKEIPLPKSISIPDKKKFASDVFNVLKLNNIDPFFSSVFFLLKDGKINSVDEFVRNCDNKKLYKILK